MRHTYLFWKWDQQDKDDDPLASNKDGHDVGKEEETNIKEEDVCHPRYPHHHCQQKDDLHPVPEEKERSKGVGGRGGGREMKEVVDMEEVDKKQVEEEEEEEARILISTLQTLLT